MRKEIGDVVLRQAVTQKEEIKARTEKSINSLFNNNVLTKEEAEELLGLYLSGNVYFGEDGLTKEEAQNFKAEDFHEIKENLKQEKTKTDLTMYVVEYGDSWIKIAQKFGYKGAEAIEYGKILEENAKASGIVRSYGLKVGDMLAVKPKVKGEAVADQAKTEKAPTEKAVKAAPKSSKENIATAKNLKKVSTEIAEELSKHPNKANKALDKITSNNVAFVLLSYNKKTGRSLARDIINNGDKTLANTMNKICHKLAQRAQQLKLKGIYFGDYLKIKNGEELIKWIEKAQDKIYAAEIKNNPAIAKEFENKKYVQVQKDSNDLKADGRKVAHEIYEQVNGPSKSYKTKSLLSQKVTSNNAAYVITEFKNLKENKKQTSLTMRLNEEIGVDIEDIKKSVCKPLVTQAKSIGLTGVYWGDCVKIKDIKALDTWVNNTAQKIVNTMNANSDRNSKVKTETKTEGNSKTKTITNGDLYKEAGISKVEEKYDKSGKLVDKTFYYENGKVVREYTDPERGRVRELVTAPPVQNNNTTKITEPVAITMTLPPNSHKEAKEFAKALVENKAELMAQLGIDNETYNRYAKLAMAIAEQETDFGTNENSTMYRKGKYYAGMLVEANAMAGGLAGIIAKLGHDFSYGPTQIKLEQYKKDEWCAKQFKHFGIENGLQLYDNKNAALATIIVLAHIEDFLKGSKYQKGMEAAKDNIITVDGWEMKDGTLQKTYNTKSFVNKVTDDDAICYLWNGRGVQILDGTAEPESLEYTRNIHKFIKNYNIKEDPNKVAEARKISEEKRAARDAVRNFKPMESNGPIGSVVFNSGIVTQQEYNIIEKALNTNNIPDDLKEKLLNAIKAGKISFKYGLSEKEANAITQNDIELLLKYAYSNNPNAETEFKKEYLNSKAVTVPIDMVKPSALVKLENNFMPVTRFKGNIKDTGVKTSQGLAFYDIKQDKWNIDISKCSPQELLALNAQKTALLQHSGGKCFTYFRKSLIESGIDAAMSFSMAIDAEILGEYIVDKKHLQYPDKDYKYNESVNYYCESGTAKGSVSWFHSHPEMFDEVQFVDDGSGNARQITSADLVNLPSGYFVMWIPSKDKQYEDQPGHACVTSGSGSAYADETDNLGWGDYTSSRNDSGKGEHGTFRVFRLTDGWQVDPKTNKLTFKNAKETASEPSPIVSVSDAEISNKGQLFIRRFETCELKAYKCEAGVWTIGYGHTGQDVIPGKRISMAEANRLFKEDLKEHQNYVKKLVKVPLTQNQFVALVSFEYNVGYARFKDSTLLQLLNEGKYEEAALEFDKWNIVNGQVSNGLSYRRHAEKALFQKKDK